MTRPKVPNLFKFSDKFPLSDDLWLGMQLRDILIVDQSIIKVLEQQARTEFIETDKPSLPTLLTLNAASQMWIFSVYEFLRTWRQRARELLQISEEISNKPNDVMDEILSRRSDEFRDRERLISIAPSWYASQVKKLSSQEFVSQMLTFSNHVEPVFRDVEIARVSLAKHEVPKTKQLVAEAPNYARFNFSTGGLRWHFNLKDGSVHPFDRVLFGESFYSLGNVT